MSNDQVLLMRNEKGEYYAIPLERLEDAKLKSDYKQSNEAIKNVAKTNFTVVGITIMPQSVRRVAYVKPTVTANVMVDMPTA